MSLANNDYLMFMDVSVIRYRNNIIEADESMIIPISMSELVCTFLKKGFIVNNHVISGEREDGYYGWSIDVMTKKYNDPKFQDLIEMIYDINNTIDDVTERIYHTIITNYSLFGSDVSSGHNMQLIIEDMNMYENHLIDRLFNCRKEAGGTSELVKQEYLHLFPFWQKVICKDTEKYLDFTSDSEQFDDRVRVINNIQNKLVDYLEKYFEDSDEFTDINIGC